MQITRRLSSSLLLGKWWGKNGVFTQVALIPSTNIEFVYTSLLAFYPPQTMNKNRTKATQRQNSNHLILLSIASYTHRAQPVTMGIRYHHKRGFGVDRFHFVCSPLDFYLPFACFCAPKCVLHTNQWRKHRPQWTCHPLLLAWPKADKKARDKQEKNRSAHKNSSSFARNNWQLWTCTTTSMCFWRSTTKKCTHKNPEPRPCLLKFFQRTLSRQKAKAKEIDKLNLLHVPLQTQAVVASCAICVAQFANYIIILFDLCCWMWPVAVDRQAVHSLSFALCAISKVLEAEQRSSRSSGNNQIQMSVIASLRSLARRCNAKKKSAFFKTGAVASKNEVLAK